MVVFPPISIATLKPLLSSIQVGVQVYWRQKSHLTGFNPPNVGLESETKTIQSLLQASLKFTPNSEMDVVGRKLKGVRRLNRIHWSFLCNENRIKKSGLLWKKSYQILFLKPAEMQLKIFSGIHNFFLVKIKTTYEKLPRYTWILDLGVKKRSQPLFKVLSQFSPIYILCIWSGFKKKLKQ